jgi:hypothetical protein
MFGAEGTSFVPTFSSKAEPVASIGWILSGPFESILRRLSFRQILPKRSGPEAGEAVLAGFSQQVWATPGAGLSRLEWLSGPEGQGESRQTKQFPVRGRGLRIEFYIQGT